MVRRTHMSLLVSLQRVRTYDKSGEPKAARRVSHFESSKSGERQSPFGSVRVNWAGHALSSAMGTMLSST